MTAGQSLTLQFRRAPFIGLLGLRMSVLCTEHAANLDQKPKTTYPYIPCIRSIPLFFQKSDFGRRKEASEG
jgi:hypothetical protein